MFICTLHTHQTHRSQVQYCLIYIFDTSCTLYIYKTRMSRLRERENMISLFEWLFMLALHSSELENTQTCIKFKWNNPLLNSNEMLFRYIPIFNVCKNKENLFTGTFSTLLFLLLKYSNLTLQEQYVYLDNVTIFRQKERIQTKHAHWTRN